MKYIILLILLAIFVLGIKKIYAHHAAQNSCFENIDNTAFKTKMTNLEEVLILDVRTTDEYQKGSITNAIHIDVLKDDFQSKVQQLDKNKTLLVYCRSGARSLKASVILCDLGFQQVYNLSNGYMSWKKN